jgi:hypothetical protein
MTDDQVNVTDAATGMPAPILTKGISTRNGLPVTTTTEAQVTVFAIGEAGDVSDVHAGNPMPAVEAGRGLAAGGVVHAAATLTSSPLVAANAGRSFLEFGHSGELTDPADARSGRVWLGFDRAATIGTGPYLDPGDRFMEKFKGAVNVISAYAGQTLDGQEWTGS